MNSNDEKPEEVLDILEGIHDTLKSSSENSELEKMTPVLDEPISEFEIPELHEQVEIDENFNILLDTGNSTETVEQQLIRTRHEEKPVVPELIEVPELTDKLSIDEITESEPAVTLTVVENIQTDGIESIDYNIQDQLQQFDQGIAPGHPQTHQHVSIQNEMGIVEADDISSNDENEQLENEINLDQQQQEIEQVADQHRAIEQIEEPVTTIQREAFDELQTSGIILQKSWEKVEMLLMENLPPQLSGAFLQLLNSRIDENRQQLFEELALLDEDTFHELLDALEIDQGF